LTRTRTLAAAAAALLLFTATASAQSTERPTSGAIEFVTGVMDYDLSGTGKTMPFGFRTLVPLAGGFSVELGATFARPDESFGRSTFTSPEARLVYSWRLGRVSPFAAGGGGFSARTRPILGPRFQATLSAGGGARVDLTRSLYAVGELRLRGITTDFAASTAEWLGGLGLRF
jgi:hypothetical protein